MKELRNLFPKIGITEEEFWEYYNICNEEDCFFGEFAIFFEGDILKEEVILPSKKEVDTHMYHLIVDIIETIFAPEEE